MSTSLKYPAPNGIDRELFTPQPSAGIEPTLIPALSFSGFCSHETGGDFYDALPLPGDRLLVVVADAMGKGAVASRYASSLRLLVQLVMEWTTEPADLLRQLNRLLYEELSQRDVFITAQAALLDARRQALTLASAGHCPMLLARGSARLQAHAPDGLPLGILPSSQYEAQTLPLEPAGCALFYTDGVTESRNLHGELYGQARLERWLADHCERSESAEKLQKGLRAELSSFRAGLPARDDETFLFVVEQSFQHALAA